MEIRWFEVLKWVGVALAAGFIGYFGRYFAMLIIDRVNRKKPAAAEAKAAPASPEVSLEEGRLKLAKKKAKAAAKRSKKENR